MDNATGRVLDDKCHHFEQLYHGSINGNQYCLGTNVGKEYMCPLISDGRIEQMPLNPWFEQQAGPTGTAGQTGRQCHQQQPLLGKYHLCPNQSETSHYQEAPFQRGQFYPRKPQFSQQAQPPEQQGGYVWTTYPDGESPMAVNPSDPYETYPAQAGYYTKRCIGDRNLYPARQFSLNQPIPPVEPVRSKPPIPPLAVKTYMENTLYGSGNGTDVAITGVGLPMNYLEVETPGEVTNRYIMNYNIVPGYYPDMIHDAIGKRPVYTARNIETDIPEIITKNRSNLVGHTENCHQPNWGPRCI